MQWECGFEKTGNNGCDSMRGNEDVVIATGEECNIDVTKQLLIENVHDSNKKHRVVWRQTIPLWARSRAAERKSVGYNRLLCVSSMHEFVWVISTQLKYCERKQVDSGLASCWQNVNR